MANLYLMRSRSDELNTLISAKLLQNYSKIYKNIAIYCPVIYIHRIPVLQTWLEEFNINQTLKGAYGFTFREAMEEFSKDPHNFFNVIIEEYEELKRKYDFVLVNSFCEFGILDGFDLSIKLAKNLNTPIAAIINDEDKLIAQKYFDHALDGRNYLLINENFNFEALQKLKEYDFITPYRFKYNLIKQSLKNKKTIVLPESEDERILRAAEILLKSKVVDLILLGDEKKIQKDIDKLGLDLSTIQIINPLKSQYHEEFTSVLYDLRKAKGMTLEQAQNKVKDRTYFGTLLIYTGKADAMVSGASTTTAQTIRPALELIKTKEGISSVSGIFFMGLEDQVLAFADCAVNPNPTPQQLATSAYVSAMTAKSFGLEPRIALLSYSSGDSGKGESVDLIKQALKIAKEKYPDLNIDGPMQFDCAYDLKTAQKKMPDSKIAGHVNVYIFPDLNAANICYKAVQRTANALAIGPILQGLKKPVNDLSRGCLVDDIVDTVILSAIQAQ
ncbi:phosphate acetyltransferase [Campylobacter sp. VicNov18]|uniref:phosphate acetyltransferase n=1 Tax=Campylobacter bilis TaxID=2691918 RepID=UPI00130DB23D|nr:phosphate acetyltransferase [Campylobacter bilis]MPV63470.1 phosphate acetyltransferase [Campylobacter hepaticus]MBM0636969.1 phosphate acetyltransferase [Campylobacter bilis]MCC8277681.1 phosphate acetyltransferase [Campylobacter bilis]MCC8299290.1 phosphate acetyltransferase [Campylobacter bilis]MCC8300590.1 phosphate acetyltransferase [Campylobacter bilis]